MNNATDVEFDRGLRILVVHNAYRQRGGEDAVVEAEVDLLRRFGHAVESYGRHNDELLDMTSFEAAAQMLWSRKTTADLGFIAEYFRPDVVHVHNTFPLISPSLYWTATALKIPVVQTLHNFRLLCPQAMFLRDGQPCEDCLGKLPWRGVMRACYRGSRTQSAALGATIALHRGLGTYQRKVELFIALSEFSRAKFVEGGLPSDRIVVKPNFVDISSLASRERDGFLFVGRLSPEKGITVLGDSMMHLPDARAKVAGEGPESVLLERMPGVTLLGNLSTGGVMEEMVRAKALLLPSIWYEGFPRVLVEAFACGLPVIASRLGAMAELIEDGRTGLLFEPGSAEDLARKMDWAMQNPEPLAQMGRNARAEYERRYTPQRNYEALMAIYARAIDAHAGRMPAAKRVA